MIRKSAHAVFRECRNFFGSCRTFPETPRKPSKRSAFDSRETISRHRITAKHRCPSLGLYGQSDPLGLRHCGFAHSTSLECKRNPHLPPRGGSSPLAAGGSIGPPPFFPSYQPRHYLPRFRTDYINRL
jgi:hypothetical protein